jgi:O-acetyl-ADP-ribose deacetylase (regulator of RNase III)
MFSLTIGPRELQLVQGDITKIAVDAMVNAANANLAGGGGVDGAIHAAGGEAIMRELAGIRARIGLCPAGSAVATGAGRLPAQFVFHAVGPIYQDGNAGEARQLESCYWTCLEMAAERSLESVSFPSISTGVYGYPMAAAAQIALGTVARWLGAHNGTVRLVKLVQYGERDHRLYCDLAPQIQAGLANRASS